MCKVSVRNDFIGWQIKDEGLCTLSTIFLKTLNVFVMGLGQHEALTLLVVAGLCQHEALTLLFPGDPSLVQAAQREHWSRCLSQVLPTA